MYNDINGYEAPNRGTLLATMTVNKLKPEIVIIYENDKKVETFELTVPFEWNRKDRNTQKSNKYAHLKTDMRTNKAKITTF